MDPITVLGAVAASAQLAGATAQLGLRLYRFYCEVKEAPAKSKELCDEVSELSSIMEKLAQTLKTVEENSNIVIDTISINSLSTYSQFVKDFSSRIEVKKNEIKKSLKWPLLKKDNEEFIAKIERHKATFTLALQNANLKLSSSNTYFS